MLLRNNYRGMGLLTLALTVAAALLVAGCSSSHDARGSGSSGVASAGAKHLVNVDAAGVAIKGYDPVAYFMGESKPVAGSPEHSAAHQGATYYFASAENKAKFAEQPARYAPQFGGYCAYGVSVNGLFDIDPATGQIVDGKLYLNKNPDVQQKFNEDIAGHIETAHKNWPGLAESKGEPSDG